MNATDAPPYRGLDLSAQTVRRDVLFEAWQAKLHEQGDALAGIYGRRRARMAAGLVVVVGVVAMVVGALSGSGRGSWLAVELSGAGGSSAAVAAQSMRASEPPLPIHLGPILMATIVVALAIYVVTKRLARAGFLRAAHRFFVPTDDVRRDLERLEGGEPMAWARRLVDSLELPSVGFSVMAWELVVPLAIQLVVAFSMSHSWTDIDFWLAASMMLLSLSALALLFASWHFAGTLRDWDGTSDAGRPRVSGAIALLLGLGSVPGILVLLVGAFALFLPTLCNAVTGVPLVWLLYRRAESTVLAERRILSQFAT